MSKFSGKEFTKEQREVGGSQQHTEITNHQLKVFTAGELLLCVFKEWS